MKQKSEKNRFEEVDKSVKTGDQEKEKNQQCILFTPPKIRTNQMKTTEKSDNKFLSLIIDALPLDLHEKEGYKYTGCNCRKSQCLKMYCVCFSFGKMCDNTCLCESCFNKNDNINRSEAIHQIIIKDPFAFSKANLSKTEFPSAGCNCKRSNCTKKYCDCFRNGKGCDSNCSCLGCQNKEKLPSSQPKKRVKLQ